MHAGSRSRALVAVLAIAAASCGGGPSDETSGPTSRSSASTTTSAPLAPPGTTAPPSTRAPSTTVSPTTTTQPPSILSPGERGEDVEALQQRLDELRYWLGPVDGVYGELTEQAVQALQKAQGLTVDGVAGPAVRAALGSPRPVVPRSTEGTVWEVDRTAQLLLLVRDGTVEWIFHTSTGTEEPYTYRGRTLLADTPPGRFTIDWQVDGWRDGALGRLYRPKYFHPDGIAIHGYGSVPAVPASHGCVRVTFAAMDFIWRNDLAPLGTHVWVYGDV